MGIYEVKFAILSICDLSLCFHSSRDFDIRWVDRTHALVVFSSTNAAQEAVNMPYNNVKLRPLSEAIEESKEKAFKCADFLLPYRQRPQTSSLLAHRLVTGALGLKSTTTPEQRAAEKKKLDEAREKRRSALKQAQDIWEGKVN